jgi:hypothetical protein
MEKDENSNSVFNYRGFYFIVKGDNNRVSDPGKIRFEQIDRVLFAIIW